MQFIYIIASAGVLLLVLFLAKNMRWNLKDENWIDLKGIDQDHAQARQLAAFLEQHAIQTRVDFQRQSATARLLYSKKINATIKVKKEDYDRALLLVKSYGQRAEKPEKI